MTLSVSTLIIFRGAATPSRTVNFCMDRSVWWCKAGQSQDLARNAAVRKPDASGFARLDRRHVVVGEAEMVADLVHQHVGDDGTKRLVVLGPVVEDRPPVEPDHVGHLHRRT